MTSTKLLIYNCFIILLCSHDNNGVAFLIMCLFFPFARYQGLQVIVEKIMTACLLACSVSLGLRITNSLSATKSLIKEAAGLLFKSCLHLHC